MQVFCRRSTKTRVWSPAAVTLIYECKRTRSFKVDVHYMDVPTGGTVSLDAAHILP